MILYQTLKVVSHSMNFKVQIAMRYRKTGSLFQITNTCYATIPIMKYEFKNYKHFESLSPHQIQSQRQQQEAPVGEAGALLVYEEGRID